MLNFSFVFMFSFLLYLEFIFLWKSKVCITSVFVQIDDKLSKNIFSQIIWNFTIFHHT